MAAPTQQLPSWLSASVLPDGETTLVFLPLTYFGPSIPLGTLFTFGGSTSPASTATSPITSLTSPASTSTSATATSSAIPTSTSTSTSSSSSTSASSFSSASSTSTVTSVPTAQSHGLEKGQLIAAIVASLLGFIFLVIAALLLYLWCGARRNRKNRQQFSPVPPLDDDDYVIIAPETGRVSPGEGSPRASGEEADPFLQRSMGIAGPSTVTAPHPPSADNSVSSAGKSSSNSAGSGYGTLLENPSLGVFVPPHFGDRHGKILSPEELRQFDDLPTEARSRLSTVGEQGEFVPLAPPPRLVDSLRSQSRLSAFDRRLSLGSQTSDPGEATLLTARRVRAQDLPRSAPTAESSSRRESGVWKGLGLGGLAALGRLSFLQNITGSSSSRRNSHTSSSLLATGLTDRDVEAGRALLNAEPGSPPDMAELQGPRFRGQLGLGVGYGGDRPISGASASANSRTSTIYHDAESSLPGTPLVMPPPRALASSSAAELGYWPPTETASSTTAAQGRSQDGQSGTQSTSASTGNPTTLDDALDMPAPRGISPFASTSSLRVVGTTSSLGSQGKHEFPYPPGLTTFSTPGVWNDTAGTTPSPGSFGATSLLPPSTNSEDAGISIDVLEEEPPSAGDNWRTLAGGNTGPRGARRTTFGMPQLMNAPDLYSEQGSLHSMRSHLSPRSTGSASVSRREQSGSSGSASSRPSARSVVSRSDGSASLAHSGSISSDDRRRKKRVQSPMSTVFGNLSPPGSYSGHGQHSSSLGSPLDSAESADKSLTLAIPSPIPEAPSVNDSSLEPRVPRSPTLSSVPWVRGLDDAWSPS